MTVDFCISQVERNIYLGPIKDFFKKNTLSLPKNTISCLDFAHVLPTQPHMQAIVILKQFTLSKKTLRAALRIPLNCPEICK